MDKPPKRRRTRKGAPGIVEVARRARVSPATVSRFFNSPEVVRTNTRKRIEQAANDLGYVRDRMAGAMHHGFSGTVGLIVPTIDNAIFAELIQAFATRLLKHDRTMLIAAHGYDLALEVGIVRALLERRIDGVVLVGLNHETAPLEMLATRNVPVLAAWNYRADSLIPCVGADNYEAGFEVTRHLRQMGHRDIALVFPPTNANDRAEDRLNGALAALGSRKQDLSPSRFIQSIYDIGAAKAAVAELLRRQPPSALVCGNDVIAQGAVYACQLLGMNIPDDISIVGIGDFRGSASMEPGLTTWRLPAKRIGEHAADLLCRGIPQREKGQPYRMRVPAQMMIRGSVRRA